MHIRYTKYFVLLLSVMAITLTGFAVMTACSSRGHERPIVTVSIEPQKYILEQITGDRIDVRCLLGNGGNPENYDPTVTHLMNLEKSLAYLRMGNIGFEDAILDKVRESNPGLAIFNTSEGIRLITGTHHHGAEKGNDIPDPHTWTSFKNARVIAANMLDAMVNVDPKHEKDYRKNFDRFAARLDSLDHLADSLMTPHRGEAFLVWHPSLSYFARDYGMEQIALGETENKEISVNALRSTIDEARSHNARVFFFQKDFDSRQVSAINDEIGATEVDINPLDYDWENSMMTVVNAIAGKNGQH